MTKRRRSAVLGAASVLMMAAGYGGFSDTETAAASIDSGTLVLGLDTSGGVSSNDCADLTRGATGEVPLGLTQAEEQHGRAAFAVHRLLCIRNLGSGTGAVALRAFGFTSSEVTCTEDEAEIESGDEDASCSIEGELQDRYTVTLSAGDFRDGSCHAGERRLAGPLPIASFAATELFRLEPKETACVGLHVDASEASPEMMTDTFTVGIETILESR